MYFEQIEIENNGPLRDLSVTFPFSSEGSPKPLVVVGKNGSGKSIFLSHLVNALMLAKAELYPNTEVETNKVYKLRSPLYISAEQQYAFMKCCFNDGLIVDEWVLSKSKKEFEIDYQYTPAKKEWSQIPEDGNSVVWNNFNIKIEPLKSFVNNNCRLYFPPNRFEEPSWLNATNLVSKPEHTDKNRVAGVTNRTIICHSPLRKNMNWLFDVWLDRELYERQILAKSVTVGNGNAIPLFVFLGYRGPSHSAFEEATKVLRIILRNENVRFGIGDRQSRVMSIIENNRTIVPHIFQLSTGETALLNLFLSILRDFDLSNGRLKTLSSITGTVIIDEIDAHLHTQLQCEVLPQLISLFPKVQFVITTHSPLFLLGMENMFGKDGFQILETPYGKVIDTEHFSEFKDAYQTFMNTEKFRRNIENEIQKAQKPIVFVEGDYDIRYIKRAADLLGKKDVLLKICLKDGNGFRNLDKIWNDSKWSDSQVVNKKILLLYDCDTKKSNEDKNNIFKRVMPVTTDSPIAEGIENLFPKSSIDKAEKHKQAFIDLKEATNVRERGKNKIIPASKKVNKDEKGNLCNWLCKNGDKNDFARFFSIFEIIEKTLFAAEDSKKAAPQ